MVHATGEGWLRCVQSLATGLLVMSLSDIPAQYTSPTPYIDCANPAVVELAESITVGSRDAREKAVRIHDFVRDRIRFGWAPAFYDQRASDVLAAGVGFCNTKSTLFVALLRALGIPARQHFVNISARILDGLIDPGTPYVDHSFAEVFLGGTWHRVDCYIVDRAMMANARARLAAESRPLGYGVHRNGVSEWDGRADAFSQFVNDGSVPGLTSADHGLHEDVGAFYASGRGANELTFPVRWLFGFFSRRANARIEAIRAGRDALP